MEFVIKSNGSDRALVFSNLEKDYFQVAIRGSTLSANTVVYSYNALYDSSDSEGLNEVFQDLGKLEKPWSDKKEWASIEGEFSLEITCDKLGHVLFTIELRILQGHPEEASIRANITTDFGLLSSIACDAKDFFEQN